MFSLQRKILKIRSLYQTMRNTKNAKTWSAPLPSLWGITADANGHLMLGGCDCREIVDLYGTPLHVMDEALLRSSYVRFSKAFARHGIRCEIYYSYKTNSVPGILKVLHDEGAGAEVISPFELWLALELKVSPDAIIYNGPGKSPEGLRLAIEKGIRRININSFCELDFIEALAAEIGAKPTVGVRLYTGVGWGDQFGFGIESGDAWRVFERLSRTKAVEIDGVHFHLGSQIHTPQLYEAAALVALKFLAKIKEAFGLRINSFDLGGGFGVPTVRVYEQADQWLQRFLQSPYASPQQTGIPSGRSVCRGNCQGNQKWLHEARAGHTDACFRARQDCQQFRSGTSGPRDRDQKPESRPGHRCSRYRYQYCVSREVGVSRSSGCDKNNG